jgi:hypothetical protein
MRTSFKKFFVVGSFVGASIAFGIACGGGSTPSGFGTAGSDGGVGNGGDGGGIIQSDGGGLGGGSDGSTGPTSSSIFYVHTNTTLYTVDPTNVSAPPTTIGNFDCIGTAKGQDSSMTDIAVSKDGSIYAVSQANAYPITVTGSTVHCGTAWPLPSKNNNFYGLTVAPENTVSTEEVLIAADDSGALWQIDSTSGATTQVGTLGTDPATSKAWELSGDIVFVANGGSPVGFATVRDGSSDAEDTLIEVDVSLVKPGTASTLKTVLGKVVQKSGCAAPSSGTTPAAGFGFKSMYGIAAYEDKVYGFSHTGDIIEIDNSDGSACLLGSIASNAFSGAGVSTSVQVVAPPR